MRPSLSLVNSRGSVKKPSNRMKGCTDCGLSTKLSSPTHCQDFKKTFSLIISKTTGSL